MRISNLKGYRGVMAGIFALLLRFFFTAFPGIAEEWYSRGIFQIIRRGLDLVFGYLPVAGVYILGALLLVQCIFFLRKLSRKPGSAFQKAGFFARGTANFCGFVLFAFYLLWGYNYSRQPLEQQLGLQLQPPDRTAIGQMLNLATEELVRLRASLPPGPVRAASLGTELERGLREGLEGVLLEHGFPVNGQVRARWIWPQGFFLRFSTAGLYLPFSGEGHVDPGLAPVQWPAVMAHELAHGYGFGDEGACSFWAILACRKSDNPTVRYAGALSWWRTLASAYRAYDPDRFIRMRDDLPSAIKGDLEDIRKAIERFPDLVPRLQYQVYDAYLKSQGIGEGMLNYDRVLLLMTAYELKNRK